MFTGIIEDVGRISTLSRTSEGGRLGIDSQKLARELKTGDSVAVNGVCLTVTGADAREFFCDLSSETLRRSSFGRLERGRIVNLERPLAVGGRLGGHFVLGHVDGVGRLCRKEPSGGGCNMAFRFPPDLARYFVYKGSVAVDGISLTVAGLESELFTVAIISHTLTATNLRDLSPGEEVNLEVDILGKYFERFFELGLIREKEELSFEHLKEHGF